MLIFSIIFLVGACFSVMVFLGDLLLGEETIEKRYLVAIFAVCVAGVCVAGAFFTLGQDKKLSRVKADKETMEWAALGCPVYKSSCGSYKHSYECERRGAVVGRNQVGDIFVNAYPICKKN